MTRATRSQVGQTTPQKQAETATPPSPKKSKPTKKRKRLSDGSDLDGHPPAKLSKSHSTSQSMLTIDDTQATALLEILQQVDTHALLERVFPDNSHASSSTSQLHSYSHSLRALLQDSDLRDVHAIKLAIRNLTPAGASLRSNLTRVATEHADFCHWATVLLEQAIQQSSSAKAQTSETLALEMHSDTTGDDLVKSDVPVRRRYAMMQKFPGGEYWTSLDRAAVWDDGTLKDLNTGQAEKVAIFPSAPLINSTRSTLNSHVTKRSVAKPKPILLTPRAITKGSYLDYGLNCSFAPSWDSEGAEAGRDILGAVTDYVEKRNRGQRAIKRIAVAEPSAPETQKSTIEPIMDAVVSSPLTEESTEESEPSESILPPGVDVLPMIDPQLEQFSELVEAESLVAENLHQNAVAIQRLNYLQRLRALKGGALTKLEQVTAEELAESLTHVLSTRPRSISQAWEEPSTFAPSPNSLARLRTSFIWGDRAQGWSGTLSDSRITALQDDLTVQVKSTATAIPLSQPTTPAPAAAPSTTPSTPYRSNYSYYPMNGLNGQAGYYPYAGQAYAAAAAASPNNYTYWPTAYNYQSSPGQKPGMNGAPISPYWPPQSPATPHKAIANTAKVGTMANGWNTPLPSHMALKRGDSAPDGRR